MIIAGDLFHQPRPSNHTLENTIRSFKRLKDAGIPVLTVDGSHDSAPNTITSTILYPLDSAGLITHLPRHQGACWTKQDCCYVYGIPTYHNRHKTQEALPKFLAENQPTPKAGVANIFVFHGAVDLPSVKGPFEAEILPQILDHCRSASHQDRLSITPSGHSRVAQPHPSAQLAAGEHRRRRDEGGGPGPASR